ncbi:MAG: hypothetical protein HY863_08690 [Chloroflexi bacterium]|nr:hypothetical protein [Chloroflexota bacterium]
MQTLKERKPLLIKLLAVVLLVLLCCNLPSLLFWPLCLKEDLFRPSNTSVLISACKSAKVFGVPNGEALFVFEGRTDRMYMLDLRTSEKRDIPDDPLLLDHGVFLSPELVWLEGSFSRLESPGYRPHYILDLNDGQRYELLELDWLPRLEGFKFDPQYYVYFQTAETVFIHHSRNALIALSPDFRQHPERNVIFSQYALSQGTNPRKGELLEQLLKDMGKGYEIVDFSLQYSDVPSPTGRYIIRGDGIYISGTHTPVVTRDMGLYFGGWYYDESGVVFRQPGYDLINFGPDFGGGYYYIPGPVLKLRLPAP